MTNERLLDSAFVCTILAVAILFDWNWTIIKVFISGGLLGVLATLRFKKECDKWKNEI